MKIITQKEIDKIINFRYPENSFRKFDDPNHPDYDLYKDRLVEQATDKGVNLGLQYALTVLGIKTTPTLYSFEVEEK